MGFNINQSEQRIGHNGPIGGMETVKETQKPLSIFIKLELSWVSVLWLASKIFCLCSTPAIININLSNDNIVLMDYVSNSKLDVDTFYQCPIRWVNWIFGNWKLDEKWYMDSWTKPEHFYASKDDLQYEWLTRSCKRSHALFQKSLLLFSTWRE